MSELLRFETREAFREWLSKNCRRREGVWLEFGKTKEVETLSANDALLEALCFGWIDGVMKYILQEVFCAAKSWQQKRTDSGTTPLLLLQSARNRLRQLLPC